MFENLPPFTRFVLDEYLKPLNPYSPDEVLLTDFFVYLSRLFCHHRVRIASHGFDIFPNLYGIIFLPSGAGKDRPLSHLNQLFAPIFESWRGSYRVFHDRQKELLQKEAETRGFSKMAQADFVEDNLSSDLVEEVQNATLEGITALGHAFTLARFGSVHFANSEFIDFIQKRDATKTALISYLKEVYEEGTNKIKVIKSSKTHCYVTGTPHTMLVHSSLAGLLENEEATQQLKEFLNRGLARRSFMCFPEKFFQFHEISSGDRLTAIRRADSAKVRIQELLASFETTYGLPKNITFPIPKKIGLSEKCFELFCAYDSETKREFNDVSNYEDESIAGDLMDRPRKALRLAAIIALTERAFDIGMKTNSAYVCEIQSEDFLFAKGFVDWMGAGLRRLSSRREVDTLSIVRDEILSAQKKNTAVTKMFLRNLRCAPPSNRRTRWVKEVIDEMPEYCAALEESFVEQTHKNTQQFRILRHSDAEGDIKVILSCSKDTVTPHPVAQYEKTETTFDMLGVLVKTYAYAPAIFKDGYREEAKIEEFGNCIIVDVDEGLTLAKAKEHITAKDFCAFVITSRHHQKEKTTASGTVYPPCDRFRIIFPCKQPLAPKHGYTAMMKNIFRYMELEKYADDRAMDAARFFFPSPTDADVFIHRGKKLLNWEMFDMEKIERKRTFRSGGTGKAEITVTGSLPNATGQESRHIAMVRYGSQFGQKYQYLNPQAGVEEVTEATKQFLLDWNATYPKEPINENDILRFVDEWLVKKFPEWKI